MYSISHGNMFVVVYWDNGIFYYLHISNFFNC